MRFNQWLVVSLPIFITTGGAAETVSDDHQPHTFSTLSANGSSAAVTSFGKNNSSTTMSEELFPTGYVNLSGETEECYDDCDCGCDCDCDEDYDDEEEDDDDENCTDSCDGGEDDYCNGYCDRDCCKCTIIVKPYGECAETSACDEESSCPSTACSTTSCSSEWYSSKTGWLNTTTIKNVTSVSATDVTSTEPTTVTSTYTLSTITASFTSTVTRPTNTWASTAVTSTVSGTESEYTTTITAISTMDTLTTTATSSVEEASDIGFSETVTTTTATSTLGVFTTTATSTLEAETTTAFSTVESSDLITVTTATLEEPEITETDTVTSTSTLGGLTVTATTTEIASSSVSSTLTNVFTSTVWSSADDMSTLEPASSTESEVLTTIVTSTISALPTDYYGVGDDEGLETTGASLKPYITNTLDLDDLFEEKKRHSTESDIVTTSTTVSTEEFVSISPYLPDGIVIATTTVTASKPTESSSSSLADEAEASNTSIWGTDTPTSVPTAPSFFPSTTDMTEQVTTIYSTVYVTKTRTHKPSVSNGFGRNFVIVDNSDSASKKSKTEYVLRTRTETADIWLSPSPTAGFNSTVPTSSAANIGANSTSSGLNSSMPTSSVSLKNTTASEATNISTSGLNTATASIVAPTLKVNSTTTGRSSSIVESMSSKPTSSSMPVDVSSETTPSTTVGVLTSSNKNLNIFDPVPTTSESSSSAVPTTPLTSNPLSSVMVNIEINKSHSDDASKAASGGERIQAVEDGIIMDGIVYSPYNNDRTCKRYRTVRDDLSLIKSKNVRSVRVYASDCNSLYTVLPAAKQLGLKVNQGLWVTSNINLVDSQVDDIIEAGNKYGWDLFTMFIVGNEVVLMNQVSAPALAAKMNEIRGRLRAAGFNGPITTAEPPSSFLQHPELCDAMDIVAVNAHPYFNAGCSADTSGSFVQGQADVSKQACPNKEVYIAETGFPSQGAPNGGNFPSVENQRTAINDIMIALDGKATFLSTFDDYWKDPGPNNIEQHFGIIEML